MKKLLLVLLFCSVCFGAIPELIQPKTLNWQDSTASDFAFYTVWCEPLSGTLSYTSPNVSDILISELSLNDVATRTALGIDTEGETYQMCVTASDNNQNRSACSAVVQYFFDMTAPPIATGVVIENR